MTTSTRGAPPKLRTRAFSFRSDTGDGAVGDGRSLTGYAAVFNSPTEINSWEGTFTEVIAPGAFKRTLNAKTPVLQFDHGHDARTGTVPIGRIDDIREDDHGLHVAARLYDNGVVEPIRQAIEGGSISGMSFRFRVVNDEWRDVNGKLVKASELGELLWNPGERGPLTCTIREVELFELGPVVFPAYTETSVGVRSMLASLDADERRRLVADLTRDLKAAPTPDSRPDDAEPAPKGTSAAGAVPAPATARAIPEPAAHGTSTTPKPKAPKRATTRKDTTVDGTLTVEERAARVDEIRSRLTEIDTEYAGAELPAEINQEWDDLNAEHDAHERAIAATAERRARIAALATEGTVAGERAAAPRDYRGVNVAPRRPENIYDQAALRQQARSMDELTVLQRDNAMRAIETATYAAGVNQDAARSRAEVLLNTIDDEEGTLARRILATGSPVYERAFGKALAAGSDRGLTTEERTALAVGAGATGGYAVPFQLDPTVILTSDGVINPLRGLARTEQITGKTWQGVTSAGITVSRAAEGAEATDNSPTLAQPEVTPTRVQGFVPFSIEIATTWSRLRAEITRMLADAKETEEATSFLTGAGTGTAPQGLLTGTAGEEVRTNGGTVGAASFDAGDVYAVSEALAPRWLARAQWLANRPIYNLVRQFPEPFWVGNLRDGNAPELIGYPRNVLSTMASALAADAKIMVFGDFSQFLIVDQIGMNVELIPHLFGTTSNFPTGQRGIYAIWRNSSKVLVPDAFKVLQVNEAS